MLLLLPRTYIRWLAAVTLHHIRADHTDHIWAPSGVFPLRHRLLKLYEHIVIVTEWDTRAGQLLLPLSRPSMLSTIRMASRVTALLNLRLSSTEFHRFTPQDIENLARKRFLDEAAFAEATKEVLQDLPGEPLPGLLINSILKTFNPSALRAQGKTRQHVA